MVTRFGSKVGQIDPKLDLPGTFSDQISVHFGSQSQTLLKTTGTFSDQISVHFDPKN